MFATLAVLTPHHFHRIHGRSGLYGAFNRFPAKAPQILVVCFLLTNIGINIVLKRFQQRTTGNQIIIHGHLLSPLPLSFKTGQAERPEKGNPPHSRENRQNRPANHNHAVLHGPSPPCVFIHVLNSISPADIPLRGRSGGGSNQYKNHRVQENGNSAQNAQADIL
jgi:hypothetical protein